MADLLSRLDRCFEAVFPGHPAGVLREATPETMEAWDSMATVTLMAVVNEEFGTDLDLDSMEGLLSHARLAEWLAGQGKA